MSKTGALVQLKVTLNGIRPPIWRRLSLPRTTTLDDLHSIILAAMGWFGGHLHMFEVGGRNYSDKFELGDALDESRITLNMLIRQGVDRFISVWVVATQRRKRRDPGVKWLWTRIDDRDKLSRQPGGAY